MVHDNPNDITIQSLRPPTRVIRFMTVMNAVLIVITLLFAVLAAWTQFVAARIGSEHPPAGIFVPVSGGRMHMRDVGPRDAPPERTLVFLHGASSNHQALTFPLEPLLRERYRIIAIDRPGHGHSDRPGGSADASLTRQAQLIGEAMAAAGAPRAIIVAHSLATTLAMDAPERVAGLVLLGPVSHPWPGGIAWYYPIASSPIVGWLFSNVMTVPGAALSMDAGLRSVFHPQVPPEGYTKATALRLMLRPASFRANAEDVAALHAHVSARQARYPEIQAPTVIIAGDQDTTVRTSIHTEALARQLPNVRLVIMPGVGHVPHHADTARVVSEIDALADQIAERKSAEK
jgi:pimeloyl-ACP methyl ester carboxylesterase